MQRCLRFLRRGFLAMAVLGGAWPTLSRATSLELVTLMEGFSAHQRVADGYLRTGNTDLALIEIERLTVRWHQERAAVPEPLAPGLAQTLSEIEALVAAAAAAAERDQTEAAQAQLFRAAQVLRNWRRANAMRLFADCIAEIADAYGPLDRHRLAPPDLGDPSVSGPIAAAAAATATALATCRAEAPAAIAGQAEFRRLIDGMADSLRQVPLALAQRDGATLHRLLIEQRSFERLLAFRFG